MVNLKLKPQAYTNYWTVDNHERKKLWNLYWMLCMNEDIEAEEGPCKCGECWECKFAVLHPPRRGPVAFLDYR